MAVDSIESLPTPQPPEQIEISDISTVREAMNGVYNWSRNVAKYHEDLYLILHSGALVRSFQVEELLAGTIGAGTISVDQIYLGSSKFELDGVLGQIRILDDAAVVMVEIGEFGGGTDWGIKVRNGSNAVVFSALSNAGTTMDGAIITNATIVDAQIVDVAGNKLTGSGFISATDISVTSLSSISANFGTITAGTINATVAINAGAINAGTLTVDGTPAILVTGGGALSFSGGGSMRMTPQAGSFNFIRFNNSSTTEKADIIYHSGVDALGIETVSGTDTWLQCKGSGYAGIFGDTVQIGLTALDNINITGKIASDIVIDADSTYDIGTTSVRLANIWADLVNGFDIVYANGWRATEPDKVYTWADPKDGLLTMNELWEPVEWLHRDGSRQNSGFQPPDVPRKEPAQTQIAREILEELDDEFENKPEAIGYSRQGRMVIHRELREWVINARDNGVVLTDADTESKKQELVTGITLGDYRAIESREKNDLVKTQQVLTRKKQIADRRAMRLQKLR